MTSQPTLRHIDALKEFINIGVGKAASSLNEMVNFPVTLHVPFIKVLEPEQVNVELAELGRSRLASVTLGFDGAFTGKAALVFPPDSASRLVAVLTGEEPGTPDLDSVRAGTLNEVGNILLNGVMGSLGNILQERINYSLPLYSEDTVANLITSGNMTKNTVILLVRTDFIIRQLEVEGNIILLFTVGSFDSLLSAIDASS